MSAPDFVIFNSQLWLPERSPFTALSVSDGRISAVGSDASHDPGLGTCGKDGQSVPVGVGLPTVRIDNLTVGGTGA